MSVADSNINPSNVFNIVKGQIEGWLKARVRSSPVSQEEQVLAAEVVEIFKDLCAAGM